MSVCAACPTPDRRHGLQAHNGTGYGIVGISREDYQRWMTDNGYGTNPPALHKLPNVVTRTAPIQAETPFKAFLASKGVTL